MISLIRPYVWNDKYANNVSYGKCSPDSPNFEQHVNICGLISQRNREKHCIRVKNID